VFASTGRFTMKQDLQKHIEAGARPAILSALDKGDGVSTVVDGVDAAEPGAEVISCARCTTNAITPRRGAQRDHDDGARLHRQSRADLDRGRDRDRRGVAAGRGQVRRHRDPRADPGRLDRRHHVRNRARDQRRRHQHDLSRAASPS
jgi:hypothetical protein